VIAVVDILAFGLDLPGLLCEDHGCESGRIGMVESAQRGRETDRKSGLLVLLGAAAGGLVGYLLFWAMAHRGLYGLALPGGLLGLGAGIFKTRSTVVPIACGFLALALGLFTEWRFASFAADGSLGYFLSHLHQLGPMTLVMIAAGALIGFYVPFRRGQKVENA
jgi:hypothetical protein